MINKLTNIFLRLQVSFWEFNSKQNFSSGARKDHHKPLNHQQLKFVIKSLNKKTLEQKWILSTFSKQRKIIFVAGRL